MSEFPKVLVLLSSFNGGKYIFYQIQSILEQKVNAHIFLLVRDDGSTDDTVAIIKSFENPRITLIEGCNLGAKASFFELIKWASNMQYDFYSFSDQDDVWKINKIQSALNELLKYDSPALYCSALELVDENLNLISLYQYIGSTGLHASLFLNANTGCTCVINNKMMHYFKYQPDINRVIMHDWWIYIVASAFGEIVYDKTSYILYRQHSNNQIGLSSGLKNYINRIKRFLRGSLAQDRISQFLQLSNTYDNFLDESAKEFILVTSRVHNNYYKRLKFALRFYPNNNFFEYFIGIISFSINRQ